MSVKKEEWVESDLGPEVGEEGVQQVGQVEQLGQCRHPGNTGGRAESREKENSVSQKKMIKKFGMC